MGILRDYVTARREGVLLYRIVKKKRRTDGNNYKDWYYRGEVRTPLRWKVVTPWFEYQRSVEEYIKNPQPILPKNVVRQFALPLPSSPLYLKDQS